MQPGGFGAGVFGDGGCPSGVFLDATSLSKGKVGYPWESTPDIYQHIPPRHVLENGCAGQYGAILGEQLRGYPPKGTQQFPLTLDFVGWIFPKLDLTTRFKSEMDPWKRRFMLWKSSVFRLCQFSGVLPPVYMINLPTSTGNHGTFEPSTVLSKILQHLYPGT